MDERAREAHADNCNCPTCTQFRRIAELEAELAEANKEREVMRSTIDFAAAFDAARTVAERDALKADAERYRWLRNGDYDLEGLTSLSGADLDAAIDAAKGEK